MGILGKIKELQKQGKLKEWFTVEELKRYTDNPEANNLSNYALDNLGSSNRNKKVLNRRINEDGKYEYSFNKKFKFK